ncbi:MAG TPA: DUF2079 domain-containing protein [Lapillicoccus sp.]|nr:DUF2079 domain-containing protein [Lapillicoccus sp.]
MRRSDADVVDGDTGHRTGLVSWLRANRVGLTCAAVFAVLYAAIALFRYTHFVWSSWDLGIFTQVVEHYARLQAPSIPIKGSDVNALGDHFSPALAVVAVPYSIVSSPVTLLVTQALLLAWSTFPVHRLASRRLGFWPGLAVTVAYAVSFGVVQAVLVDFHEVALAVPLVAYAVEGLAEHRWRQVLVASVPLVLVKEDLGLTVAAIGLVCALRGARRLGILLGAFGLVASAVEVLWLVPALSTTGGYAYFAQFGSSGSGAGSGGIGSIFAVEKLGTLLKYTWVTAGLCWLSTLSLVALPTLAWRFVSSNVSYWGTDWHYDLILMPVVFGAAIEAVERLARSERPAARWYARAVPLALAGIAVTLFATSSAADLARPSAWAETPRQRALASALAAIPPGAVVQSDLGLLSHLVGRNTVYWVGHGNDPPPGYIVVDAGAGWTPPPLDSLPDYFAELHPGHTWQVVSAVDGVVVLQQVT